MSEANETIRAKRESKVSLELIRYESSGYTTTV